MADQFLLTSPLNSTLNQPAWLGVMAQVKVCLGRFWLASVVVSHDEVFLQALELTERLSIGPKGWELYKWKSSWSG
jgi:hypothetical protein